MHRGLSMTLELATVTLVAWFLASAASVYFLASTAVSVPKPTIKKASAAATKTQSLDAFAAITGRNLFKAINAIAPPKKIAAKKDLAAMPLAKINAKLLGTIYSDEPAWSRAIVFQNNKQEILKIGEKIQGMPIHDIKRRAVVLIRGGKEELLLIDTNDKDIAALSDTSHTVSRAVVRETVADLENLMTTVVFQPAGKGYKIVKLQPNSFFQRLGLKQNDILVQVNDLQLDAVESPFTLMQMLNESRIKLKFNRDGKDQVFTYNLTK